MSEKRFTFRPTQIETFHLFEILDNGERLCIVRDIDVEKVVDLLNEQQSTINKLKSDIEETEISIKLFEDDVQVKDKKIEEQQATIEEYKDFCLNLCKFLIQKGLVDEYREKYGKEYKIITKWWNDE